MLVKNGCQSCNDVIKKVFMNKDYIEQLNKTAIAVMLNSDHKSNFPQEMYWSNVYPTLFFVRSEDEIFIDQPLYDINEKNLKEILKEVN
jgi:thioredoxin-related protein